jgi:uroporphyrinogen decarboxylase
VHAKGKYLIKHTDGNVWPILDMMIEAGIDAWQGIQPAIGMTLPRLQERYAGRLCFWGGVDVDTLVAGSEEEVAEQVRVACESAPRDGGLVLTCGNSVMVGVKYSNYMAMLEAAKRYGSQ